MAFARTMLVSVRQVSFPASHQVRRGKRCLKLALRLNGLEPAALVRS